MPDALRVIDALESLVPSVALMHGVSAKWNSNHIVLNWFGDIYHISLDELNPEGDIPSLLLIWAINNCRPNLEEANELGGYKVWDAFTDKWQIHVSRGLNASCAILLVNSIPGDFIFDKISPLDFNLHLSGTILEINSNIRCSSALFSMHESDINALISDYYEVNPLTRCLIRPHGSSPLLFGHKDVINRLGATLIEDYRIVDPSDIFVRQEGHL